MTATTTRAPRRKDGPTIIKSGRVNRTRSGEVYDRSAPLTRDDAERMSAALATLPGFTDVEAISTKHASSDGRTWFVRWHRTDSTLPSALSAMQQTRVERAIHQAPEMEAFLVEGDSPLMPRRWVLHNVPEFGYSSLYYVTFNSCTCPDMQYRGVKLTACKHIHFLLGHLSQRRRKRTQEERELDASLNGW
ncbi:MAG: hypothetical protein JWN14_33 [Chthonomonadales bacterium]|nr:hypothetical protein [Chthonomonadales bacterium]